MWNRSEDQMTLVLIRHGATKANKQHRYLGKTDEMLSEEGKQELFAYTKRQCYPPVDMLFTSPMKRCIQTAEILYPDLQPLQIKDWTEMDFGAFEGKSYTELCRDIRYQAWIDSNGTLPFPGGESREDFILRCEKGFGQMQKEVLQIQKSRKINAIGAIVHGGTIMALLSRFYGGDYFDYQLPNGNGYICTVKNLNGTPEFIVINKLS